MLQQRLTRLVQVGELPQASLFLLLQRFVFLLEVADFFFRHTRIGLEQFITAQRRNGLAGMIGRIRSLAQSIVQK